MHTLHGCGIPETSPDQFLSAVWPIFITDVAFLQNAEEGRYTNDLDLKAFNLRRIRRSLKLRFGCL